MTVLILKNVPSEGPGTIEDFLAGHNIRYSIIDLASEEIPGTVDFDALVILGGPMSANDADKIPYIKKEIELVRDFSGKGKKVLGICLGAQIMARAFGARVYPGTGKEIGWYDIELDDRGGPDRLMGRLAQHPQTKEYLNNIKVFQWHGETFDIPEGAVCVAKSQLYPNQAFRYGENVYAFQFHIEVSKQMIFDWLKNESIDMKKIEQETEAYYADYAARARSFYESFFRN